MLPSRDIFGGARPKVRPNVQGSNPQRGSVRAKSGDQRNSYSDYDGYQSGFQSSRYASTGQLPFTVGSAYNLPTSKEDAPTKRVRGHPNRGGGSDRGRGRPSNRNQDAENQGPGNSAGYYDSNRGRGRGRSFDFTADIRSDRRDDGNTQGRGINQDTSRGRRGNRSRTASESRGNKQSGEQCSENNHRGRGRGSGQSLGSGNQDSERGNRGRGQNRGRGFGRGGMGIGQSCDNLTGNAREEQLHRGYGSMQNMRGQQGGGNRGSGQRGSRNAQWYQGAVTSWDCPVLSNKELEIMDQRTGEDNALFLMKNMPKLEASLDSQNSKPERVETLLRIFAKLCQSTTLALNIQKVMSTIASSEFFQGQVVDYLSNQRVSPHNGIVSLLILFRYLLNNFPTTCHGKVTLMLPRLKLLFVKNAHIKTQQILEEYEKVVVLHEAITEKINRGDCLDDDTADEDPNDFINKPILPNVEDVGPGSEPPDLKENIVTGKYKNAFQYLDTQFCLLREDLIGPLRAGIKQYREYKFQGKEVTRLDDGYCYNNVKLLQVESKSRGLACRVQFDISHMKRIKWESSKRLLHGNLVCLSSDDFESIICATIEERETNDLMQGQVVLLLESGLMTMLGDRRKWTMIEATSYLESYRHVLLRLQQLGEEMDCDGVTLPFERYLLKCQASVEPPQYLTEQPDMDFKVLVPAKAKTREERIETINDAVKKKNVVLRALYQRDFDPEKDADITKYEQLLHIQPVKEGIKEGSTINALDPAEWGNLPDLGLDHSQIAALQNAITHELSVIQGPPGTGKTYIGLKFVELLLSNRKLWYNRRNTGDQFQRILQGYHYLDDNYDEDVRDESRGNHIMVMCYTNHALDQFLEGILDLKGKVGTNMLRIGGRCKNERLEPYTLRRRGHPKREDYEARDRIRDEIKRLDDILKKGMKAFNYKPSDLALRKVIPVLPETHFASLKNCGLDMVEAVTVWLDGANINQVNNEHYKETLKQVKSLNPGAADHEGVESLVAGLVADLDLEEEARWREALQLLEHDVKEQQLERELDEEDWLKKMNNQKQKKKVVKDQNVMLPIHIRRRLNQTAPMEFDVADNIVDVWRLAGNQRVSLYLHWCSIHLENEDIKVQRILKDLNEDYDLLDELNKKIDYETINNAEIIGLTTTGAAKYHDLIQRVKPKIVIVEEAAEVLEAHIVTALTEKCEHLVLIGDHKQLRPNPTMYKLAREYNLDISLFERMVRNRLPVSTLEFQHRMRPEISQFLVPHIYTELHDHKKVFSYDHVKGIQNDVVFLNHNVPEDGVEDTRSHTNDHEAALVVGLCEYLLQQGYKQTQITVLTMYSGQMFQIRKRMRHKQAQFYGIRVVPVDNYQGEENDVIIMSYVRSNTFGKIGFLKASNRICVSISRAKMGFYCFGNFLMYAKARGNDVWRGIVADALKKGMLKDNIPFICANHGKVTKISTEGDFKKVPCGGCSEPCNFRLPCGHVCDLSCHPYDPEHTEYQCKKQCERKCRNGHRSCPYKCFEECKPCHTLIPVKKKTCGHEYTTECFKEDHPCPQPCERLLPCDHVCSELCGAEKCTEKCPKRCKRVCRNDHKSCKLPCWKDCLPCKVQIPVVREDCGHCYNTECHKEHNPCPEPCTRELPCGHTCSETCGQACAALCAVVVPVKRDCGHEYDTLCYKKDFPCQKPCRKKLMCGHLCPEKCSETCSSSAFCTQPCTRLLSCRHVCKKECYQTCQSSSECDVEVDKVLTCGHTTKVQCKNQLVEISCQEQIVVTLPCKHRKQVLCRKSTDPMALQCQIKVKYQLDCKHDITSKCFEREKPKNCQHIVDLKLPCEHKEVKVKCHVAKDGSYICKEKAMKQLPCKHHWAVECNVDVKDVACKADCEKKLTCGHICQGSCSACQIVHQECRKKCEKRLICSHPCRSQCGKPCGPCMEKSEYRCYHREHRKDPCSGLSISCQLPCMWQCPHHFCTKRCSERCDRPPCDEPCLNLLPCNHLCMGLCGEPCPFACPKCRPRLFGKFGKEKTRCVSLHPCGHVLPMTRMDEVMERTVLGDFTDVTVKYCPLQSCTKPVLFCPRYGGMIREYLHVLTREHKKMKEEAQRAEKPFDPDLDLLWEYIGRIEELAESNAKVFKNMSDYKTVVTSMRLRLLSASKTKMKEEEYRIIQTVSECSLVQLEYMQAAGRCSICCKTKGGPRDCRCLSPLERFSSLEKKTDANIAKNLQKLRRGYKPMESLAATQLSTIEMEERPSVPTAENKWYRCQKGHFLCIPSGTNHLENVKCVKCLNGEPDELEEEERLAAENRGRGFRFRGGFGQDQRAEDRYQRDFHEFREGIRQGQPGRGGGRGRRGRGRGGRGRRGNRR
ncbi:NFX1-type zinc finger-containing protein 1-like [Lineus longissimus]|uniref:NFX1-type zinc finger-containing protein 1-like n=1 Tax=Lineus longissimus TaxID=88925 RepID=UPI00315DA8D4